jgi:hypothetical protein
MLMEKHIKDYLYLYGIDCNIMTPDGLGSVLVIYPKAVEVSLNKIVYQQVMKGRKGGSEMHYKYFYTDDLKLALRPLSDISVEEITQLDKMFLPQKGYAKRTVVLEAERTHYLLSKHFDLFGLIEAGLAIDKTTLPNA